MKWSELEAGGCKVHPNNKQLPGVCSSCLRDKLSQLCNPKPIDPLPSPSLSLSYSSQTFSSATASSFNYVSPAYRRRHRRHASNLMDSVSSSMLSFNYGLKKSSSVAFASRNRLREDDVSAEWGMKKKSFWSKLLKFTRKDPKETTMHSRTTREGRG